MKFSIIIPVYNVEKYLSACIESILCQSFNDYEIILVDDGSTDHSPEICDSYIQKDDRIKVIHKTNGGQSDARNVGLHLSIGEYVFFVDSDDLLYSNMALENISNQIVEDPDVVFHKHIKWFESTGEFSKCSYDYIVQGKESSFETVLCELIDKGAYGNAAWKKVVKRKLLVDNCINFQTGISAEDNDWFYKVLMVMHSVKLLDEVCYVYRQRSGSVTHSKSDKLFDNMMWIIEKWGDKVHNCASGKGEKVILNDLAYQYCNTIINYCHAKHSKEAYNRLEKYKYLLQYSNRSRVRSFRNIINVVGLKGFVILLSVFMKIKGL